MAGYWIFIVKDHVQMGKLIPAREVLANRVKNKFWSLNPRAPNVRRLEKGDKVLFYITESSARGFMGRGVLAGKAHPITDEQRFHVIGTPSIAFDYSVDFEEAEMWSEIVSLDLVKDKMPLLIGRKNPAQVFRGAIRRITEKDYEVVLEARKNLTR